MFTVNSAVDLLFDSGLVTTPLLHMKNHLLIFLLLLEGFISIGKPPCLTDRVYILSVLSSFVGGL